MLFRSLRMTDKTIAGQCVAKMIDNDTVVNGLGIRLISAEQGRAVLAMTVRADMLNSLGQCHGGMSFTLADAAFACATVSNNQAGVGAHAAMDYIRPGLEGDVLMPQRRCATRENRRVWLRLLSRIKTANKSPYSMAGPIILSKLLLTVRPANPFKQLFRTSCKTTRQT